MSALSCSSFEIDSLASLSELIRLVTFSSTLSLFVATCDCCFRTCLISESTEASSTLTFFLDSLTDAIEFLNSVICDSKIECFSLRPASSIWISGSLESICEILLALVASLLFAASDWCMEVASSESIDALAWL